MNPTENGKVAFVATNNFWKEFIDVYRKHPTLWDRKSECYRNRVLKKEAYKTMAEKLKEIDKNATFIDVKRKLNSFRSCHRRELRRARKCQKAGREFHSTLWYYEDFAFLREENGSVSDGLSDEGESREANSTTVSKSHGDERKLNFKSPQIPKIELVNKPITEHTDTQPQPDKPSHSDKASHSDKSLQSDKPTASVAIQEDESEIFGKSWVLKYRRLSETQKIFAMRAIDEIFYKGLLGQLCERTTITELPLPRNANYSEPNTQEYAIARPEQGYEPSYFESVSIKMDTEHMPSSDF